ncbi:hypothetical protein AB0L40_05880 [Patulibacter sp. NPDC049589]|uniref:hypothetical protein n=1 Tax=Patulibacter sp. NPDC049589 TaxID=3154731 RepID=UPI00341C7A64
MRAPSSPGVPAKPSYLAVLVGPSASTVPAEPSSPAFLVGRSSPTAPGPWRRAALAAGLAASIAAVAGPSAAQAQAPAPKSPHVLTTTSEGFLSRLGPVRVNTRTSTLSAAYRAFGRPTTSRGKGTLRRVRWKAAGVSIVAATFGGCRRKACRTSELRIQSARVTGPRWQTAAGLRVGEPMARIAELYVDATPPADGSGDVVLQDAFSYVGEGGDIPIVTARVRGGVVSGFDVWVGAAGE